MRLLKNGEIDLNFKKQNDIIPPCMSLRFLAVYRLLAKLINVDVSSVRRKSSGWMARVWKGFNRSNSLAVFSRCAVYT